MKNLFYQLYQNISKHSTVETSSITTIHKITKHDHLRLQRKQTD